MKKSSTTRAPGVGGGVSEDSFVEDDHFFHETEEKDNTKQQVVVSIEEKDLVMDERGHRKSRQLSASKMQLMLDKKRTEQIELDVVKKRDKAPPVNIN